MSGADELNEIAAVFARKSALATSVTRPIVEKGAVNIKNAMVADAQGIGHAPLFPASIGYDMIETFRGPGAEIGPDKSKPQGALGNILYFGTSNNAPVRDINVGIDAEAPVFEKFLADVAEPDL